MRWASSRGKRRGLMIEQADPLWDPEQPGDETLERLSSLLGR